VSIIHAATHLPYPHVAKLGLAATPLVRKHFKIAVQNQQEVIF